MVNRILGEKFVKFKYFFEGDTIGEKINNRLLEVRPHQEHCFN